MPISPVELLIVVAVIALLFGSKRLPALGRQIGTGLRDLRGSLTAHHEPRDADAAGEVPPPPPARDA